MIRRLFFLSFVPLAVVLALGTSAQTPLPPNVQLWPESYLPSTGEVTVPVLLVQFKSTPPSPPPFSVSRLEDHLFADSGAGSSLTDYFREVSYGRFVLRGEVHGWFQLPHEHSHYEAGCSGTCSDAGKRVKGMIEEAVRGAEGRGVDFGRYDNDGPDGQANSGDDDGFVDLLVLAYGDRGPWCRLQDGSESRGINAHEQKYWNVAPYSYLETSASSRTGGRIWINEFIVVPGEDCQKGDPNPIGAYAHEIGHALGLPDLVDQDWSSGGIGYWSLMADGSSGGNGRSSDIPVHPSVWAKERLGWVVPRTILDGGDYQLRPIERHPDAIRIPLDPSLGGRPGQYYLLEVRSRHGFHRHLPGTGLLVWRIDEQVVAEWDGARRANRHLASVNDEDERKGVVLLEADGRRDLAYQMWLGHCGCFAKPGCAGRCEQCCAQKGDSGDPFPGTSGADEFADDSRPRAFGGVALCTIQQVGDEVHFLLETDGDCD